MTDHPTTDELWRWTATDLARGIAEREISSREAVTSCLNRIETVNPTLNALVDLSPERALDAAELADRMTVAGRACGALHGVPTSIKDNTDEAGRPNTDGVPARAGAIAATDSASAAALRAAGAVFVGRSNVPSFSFRWITDNDLHGRTLNPWDATRTPGGSSGGAASAVASGMVPVAHGNDIGGSIRYPAYACGVTGLRPTAGRLPSSGTDEFDLPMTAQLFAVQGPIARTVVDLRLMYQAMLAPDARDPFYAHGASAPAASRPRRVGLVRTVGIADASPDVNAALDQAAAALTSAGYEVAEIELPVLAEAYRLWYLLVPEELRMIRDLIDAVGGKGVRTSIDGTYACAADLWGAAPTMADFIGGFARRNTLVAKLSVFMDEWPIVLTPVSTEAAFEQDADLGDHDNARWMAQVQWSQMAVPTLGFPALAVPTGVAHGLPTGVQLIARRFDEASLLDAGAVIEAARGVLTPVDPS